MSGTPSGRWQWGAMGLLGLGLVGLPLGQLLSGLVIGLGVLTLLKLWEARSIKDYRLVGLLQLVLVGLLATLRPGLAPSLLQGLATVIALTGLLAIELGDGPHWKELLRRSTQAVLASLPMALVLFLLIPRLGPLTPLPEGFGQGAVTGLSANLDPGSIASLTTSQESAARVVFPSGSPPPVEERYWRVLVHRRFDGRQWSSLPPPEEFLPQEGQDLGAAAAPAANVQGLQIWVADPSGLDGVPWSGAGLPVSKGLRVSEQGVLLNPAPTGQRRLYGISSDGGPGSWRQTPPTPEDLTLPRGQNPRLEALAAQWAELEQPETRLRAAEQWFRGTPFRYTLQPGALPERAPLDSFLFERQQGFCGHFASAFTALMRAAGVPARVVSGYQGGEWVTPWGGTGYLEIRQADAHAWSEVWLDGEGWRRVDPTAWIQAGPGSRTQQVRDRPVPVGPWHWFQRQWWGLDLAWSSFWLGFDRSSQEALLQRLLGPWRPWAGLLALVAFALSLAVALLALGWLRSRSSCDPWRQELDRLLAAFGRRGVVPAKGETLPRFVWRMSRRWPDLEPDLERFASRYQNHLFAAPTRSHGQAAGGRALERAQRRALIALRRERKRVDQQLRRLTA